jgi:hypothetical protein
LDDSALNNILLSILCTEQKTPRVSRFHQKNLGNNHFIPKSYYHTISKLP